MKGNVLTGQQIGLLGGPLYTVYKVIGAIKKSEEINGNAVYWLETNDADFNEISKIHFIDKFNKLKTLKWNKNTEGRPVGLVRVDHFLLDILDQFFNSIVVTEFTEALRRLVFECYTVGSLLGDCSIKLAQELFNGFSLMFFDPSCDEFRKFTHPILKAEAEYTENGSQCNLFCLVKDQRKAVFKENNRFFLRDGSEVILDDYPLLPNVKTRNVCQDAFFNTHSYIAGPGEIKYIAELDPVYSRHNVRKSKITPRMSVSLIEPKVTRLLKQTNCTATEIITTEKDVLLKEIRKKETGVDFGNIDKEIKKLTQEYVSKLEEKGLNTKNLKGILNSEVKAELGRIRNELNQIISGKLEKVDLLSDNLLPYGIRQERVFNAFYYMNLIGKDNFFQLLYKNHIFKEVIMELYYA